MSAFVHTTEHIDVCVQALRECRFVRFEGLYVQEWTPSDLGRRLLTTNVESVLWRYTSGIEEDERNGYEGILDGYRFTRPAVLDGLAPTRRLVTFMQALTSLDYQCCELEGWDAHPVARLIQDAKGELSSQLAAIQAHPNAWAFGGWSGRPRGLGQLRQDYERATEPARAGETLTACVAYAAALVHEHAPAVSALPLILCPDGLSVQCWDGMPEAPSVRAALTEALAHIPPVSLHRHDTPGWVRDEEDPARFTINIPAVLGLPAMPAAA